MRDLIVLACVFGAAMGQYWDHGGVHDTPEVEAAKAAHFAAHAEAKARLGHSSAWEGGHESSWTTEPEYHHQPASHWEQPTQKWTGPIAHPPGYDKNGAPLPVDDTPEVKAAKAKFFQLYSHGAYAGAYAAHDHQSSSWSSPTHQSDWTPTSGPWGY